MRTSRKCPCSSSILARNFTHKVPEEPAVAETEVEKVLDVDSTMSNWGDWAKMLLRCSVSATRFTRKPLPAFQPPLGGLTVILPKVPSTSASKI